MDTHHTFRHCTMFLTGVVVCACGIAFISRAGLGTSPISRSPFSLSLVTPPVLTTGLFTFCFNIFFLVLDAIVQRKFTPANLLQIPCVILFSICIDLAMSIIPTRFGGPWLPSCVYLLIGCILMGLGITLEVLANYIMLPGEAIVHTFAEKMNVPFGTMKVTFDSILTVIAIALALFFFHKLNGVREGTMVTAFTVHPHGNCHIL